jgi:hypothetical protein
MFGVFLLSSKLVGSPFTGNFISTNFIVNFLSNYVQNADIVVS